MAWNYKGDGVFLIIAPNYPMLDRTTWEEFKRAAKPLIVEENNTKKIITLSNGNIIHGHSAEHPDRIRNETASGFWIDEARECKDFARLWDICLGRVLSTGGKGFVTTSPNSFDDIYDIFIDNKKDDYGTVRFATYDNTYLDKEAIDSLATKYDKKFADQELYGKIVSFEGQVYYAFDRTKNSGQLAFEVARYNPDLPIYLCADFNVDPMAWVICQPAINDKGLAQIYVVDEIFLRNSNTIQVCNEFKQRYHNHRSELVLYGDATGNARSTNSNVTNWKIIKNELAAFAPKSKVPTKNPAERDRINSVNAMLCNSKDERHVLINPKCKNLIRDLEQVSFKEGSVQIDKNKDIKLTHPSDAFGYMVDKEFGLNKGEIKGIKADWL